MPRASIGGELSVNSRKAREELKSWERELHQSLQRQGKMSSEGGQGRKSRRSATETNQALELMSKGAGLAKTLAGSVLKADTTFEQLVRALASASDGTETLDAQIKELAKTGSLPGLNFEIAVRGALKLQTLGYSAQKSRDFISELGNQIAKTGGTVENMDGFLIQMVQTLSKGKVEMQDFKIMSEHLTGFMKLADGLDRNNAKDFFGGVLARLQEGPRVISGNTEAFKNLMDQWQRFQAESSGGKVAGMAASFAEAATSAMQGKDWLGEGGIIDSLGTGIKDAWRGTGKKANPIQKFAPSDEELLERKRIEGQRALMEHNRFQESLRLEKAKAKHINWLNSEIQKAQESGDRKKLADLEDQLDTLQEAKEVAAQLGISEQEAARYIRELNKDARQYRDEQADAANEKAVRDERKQMEIDKLRSRGKNKQADKIEKTRFLEDETARLKKQGLSEEDARAMAEEKQRIKEDADYFAKTGKVKMRGAKSNAKAWGIDEAKKGGFDFANFIDTGIPGFAENYGPGSNKKQQAAAKAAAAKKAQQGPSIVEEGIGLLKTAISKFDKIAAALLKPTP